MPKYSNGYSAAVARGYAWRTIDNSAAHLKPHLSPTTRLLDVGCGFGSMTNEFAQVCESVVGTDIGDEPIAIATHGASELGLHNVTYQVADATRLPFADASFDIVHCHQVLTHVHDPVAVLREMRRVTKPGGLVAARECEALGWTWWPDLEDLHRWRDILIQIYRTNGGEPNAGRRLKHWARLAGFDTEDVRCTVGSWCFSTTAEREYWGSQWLERMLSGSLANDAQRYGLATQADLERIAGAWRRWIDDNDGWFNASNGEILCRR